MNNSKPRNIIARELEDTKILLRSVPSIVMVFFCNFCCTYEFTCQQRATQLWMDCT